MTSRQVAEATERLAKEPTVLSLDPSSLEDVLGDILRVGQGTETEEKAEVLASSLRRRIDGIREKAAGAETRPVVACLEWMQPLLCAGHWVPEMIELAGGVDCLGDKSKPSFGVDWERVLAASPEVIVVAPCGFDVKRTLSEIGLLTEREGWASLPAVQKEQVYVVDANSYTSRSGPRLVSGLEILAEIIHPELFSGMVPEGGAARIYGRLFAA